MKIDFEAVPMGFETAACIPRGSSVSILKQSLWDLKRELSRCIIWKKENFEAVPMGFETLST